MDGKEVNLYNVINEGVSCEKVYMEMYERLPTVLSKYDSIDLLILQGGTNDILQMKEFKEDLDLFSEFEKLFVIAKNFNGKKLCLLTTMEGYFTEVDDAVMSHEDSNDVRVGLNEKLVKYASKKDRIILCDIAAKLPYFNLDPEHTKLLWGDKLHPSIKGYEKMAEIIYETVIDYLL